MRCAKKLHAVVIIVTKGEFKLNPNHKTTKKLVDLISLRNKLVHRKSEWFDSNKKGTHIEDVIGKINPLYSITKDMCDDYYEAITMLKEHFFVKYQAGFIEKTELILEVQ